MNAMDLHNVHAAKGDDKDDSIETAIVHPVIAEVIWELASKYPLWQFHATYGTRLYNRTQYVYTTFEVKLNNKLLGEICRVNNRRGGVDIGVKCKRIADKLERKSFYETSDAKKAIAKVRKEFQPKTTSEIISEAMEKAVDEARNIYHNTDRKMRGATHTVHGGYMDFFNNGPGLEIYKSYLRPERYEDATILAAMDNVVELQAEMATISSVKERIGKEGTALVVLDEGKYLVKILDDLQMYSDTTLPENLKGKLGLLKLVQPNQFVSSAGYRVAEEVFVIDLAQA